MSVTADDTCDIPPAESDPSDVASMTSEPNRVSGPDDPNLTPREAAQRLGVSERTITRMIAAGTLPAYRIGPRLLRVRAADIAALLAPTSEAHHG